MLPHNDILQSKGPFFWDMSRKSRWVLVINALNFILEERKTSKENPTEGLLTNINIEVAMFVLWYLCRIVLLLPSFYSLGWVGITKIRHDRSSSKGSSIGERVEEHIIAATCCSITTALCRGVHTWLQCYQGETGELL